MTELTVKLKEFEGPLDLLLHLIKEAKIDIREIFVSEVTEQFLGYIKEIASLELDRAGEFMETAATLVEIKSRALLPKIEEMLPPEEDPKEKLFRQLEEYKLFQTATENLKTMENLNRFYRRPDEHAGDTRYIIRDMTLDLLLDAYAKILHRADIRESVGALPKSITRERFTVAEKVTFLRDRLLERRELKFFELFDADSGKIEIITTFIALLELLKRQFIRAEQTGIYEDIIIKATENLTDNTEIEAEEEAEEIE